MATNRWALNYQAGDYVTEELNIAQADVVPLVVAADPTRVLLVVCVKNVTDQLYLTTEPTPTTAASGLPIPTTGAPLFLRYHDWGPMVGLAWYLANQSGPVMGAVLTVFTVCYRPGGG